MIIYEAADDVILLAYSLLLLQYFAGSEIQGQLMVLDKKNSLNVNYSSSTAAAFPSCNDHHCY